MTYNEILELLENAETSQELEDAQTEMYNAEESGEINSREFDQLRKLYDNLEDTLPCESYLIEKENKELLQSYYDGLGIKY